MTYSAQYNSQSSYQDQDQDSSKNGIKSTVLISSLKIAREKRKNLIFEKVLELSFNRVKTDIMVQAGEC